MHFEVCRCDASPGKGPYHREFEHPCSHVRPKSRRSAHGWLCEGRWKASCAPPGRDWFERRFWEVTSSTPAPGRPTRPRSPNAAAKPPRRCPSQRERGRPVGVAVGGDFSLDTGGLPLLGDRCWVRIAGLALPGPPGAVSEPPSLFGALRCISGCYWALLGVVAGCFQTLTGVSFSRCCPTCLAVWPAQPPLGARR